MKYATWKLNFTNPKYGTGPETSIANQGGSAEGAYSNGDITQGAKILGYFSGKPTNLEAWDFAEITQEEALEFVLAIDETAYLANDNRIAVFIEDEALGLIG